MLLDVLAGAEVAIDIPCPQFLKRSKTYDERKI
jgi:hypothetical protein